MIGQTQEAAIWYKTPEQREQAKRYIQSAFNYDEGTHGLIFGPIVYTDADLNSRRAPKPPEPGAKLLIGEAMVLGVQPTRGEQFVANLDQRDLETLRNLTQKAWMADGSKPLPLDRLDQVIADTAPDVMDKMLRYGHERRVYTTH